LGESYPACRRINREHGRTYYLSTFFLPRWKRHHVHALYGFARYADDIVDGFTAASPEERAAHLDAWSARFLTALENGDLPGGMGGARSAPAQPTDKTGPASS